MANYRRKSKWKSILCGVLVVATLIGACAGIAAIAKKDTKTISSMAFSVGAIGEDGNYLPKSNKSIYTKDLFECQGLSIEPDFEATGTYQVFYYGEDKNFVGSTNVLNVEDGVYNKGTTFLEAKYARIMITPDVPSDEDGTAVEDFKIRFYEVVGYASDYTITVDKKQSFEAYNYFVNDPNMIGKKYVVSEGALTTSDDELFYASKWFEILPGTTVKVGVKDTFDDTMYVMFCIKKADGTYTTSVRLELEGTNSGDLIWEEYTFSTEYDIDEVCLFVQDCTGEYPKIIINHA